MVTHSYKNPYLQTQVNFINHQVCDLLLTSMAIKRKRERDASWSELGIDPLGCILRKLPFLDLLRFKSVCRSWFSVAENCISSPSYSPCFRTPWLLVAPEEDDDDDEKERRLCFFNLDEKKVYRVDACICREVYEGRCVGSSHDWLILLDKTANMSVFNPFSEIRISVGSLRKDLQFINPDTYLFKHEPRLFVPKAVVMSDNEKNKDKDGVVLIYECKKMWVPWTQAQHLRPVGPTQEPQREKAQTPASLGTPDRPSARVTQGD